MNSTLPRSAGESGLDRYFADIRRFPVLKPEEEYMLARRYREYADTSAAHRLVTSHLRLVGRVALGFRGYGLPLADVIAEGNIGLMHAVKRFDPDRGFRLATYAIWWIRAAIQEYILKTWSLVKLGTTTNQKKLFFNLRKAKARISALTDGDLSPEQADTIAHRLGVSVREVQEMNRRLDGDASLNAPLGLEPGLEMQDMLADGRESQESLLIEDEERNDRHHALIEALRVLNAREARIFEARRLSEAPETLETLAAEFSISRERVRQIEARAFEKVQAAVKRQLLASGA
jgi:RNA polymerase sigma-32 factor